MKKQIKILLADDHKIIRDGLRTLIQQQKDMDVIAEADNGRDAVQLAKNLSPDVIIMDISMPDLNGIVASKQILKHNEFAKIIILSMHSARKFVTELLSIGVVGYLLKDGAFEELAIAIRCVVLDKQYLSPGINDVVLQDFVKEKYIDKSRILSSREKEVLQLMTEGKNTKETASCLYVSVKTIESHRQNIMKKLNIFTIAELTKYAIREGFTSLNK